MASAGKKRSPPKTEDQSDTKKPRLSIDSDKKTERVKLNPADCNLDFDIEDNGLQGHALHDKGFAYCWSGARATVGIRGGKYCFSCKIIAAQEVQMEDTPADQQHVCRVGISRGDDNVGNLGETDHSFGFGGTGKFSTGGKFLDYGSKFSVGDTILCAVNLDSHPLGEISFSKNGTQLGVAKRFDSGPKGMEITDTPLKKLTWESALFPHVLLKNVVVQMQFSIEDGLVPLEDYKPWDAVLQDGNGVVGPQFSSSKECEVLMMVGLPAAGKSTWAESWVKNHPEKRYMVLGTNLALDQMKIAVVIFPSPQELKVRAKKRFKEMGKEVPPEAVNEMLANYVLPTSKDMRGSDEAFDEVWFPEVKREEALRILETDKTELKATSITKSRDASPYAREASVSSVNDPRMLHTGVSPGLGGSWRGTPAPALDHNMYTPPKVGDVRGTPDMLRGHSTEHGDSRGRFSVPSDSTYGRYGGDIGDQRFPRMDRDRFGTQPYANHRSFMDQPYSAQSGYSDQPYSAQRGYSDQPYPNQRDYIEQPYPDHGGPYSVNTGPQFGRPQPYGMPDPGRIHDRSSAPPGPYDFQDYKGLLYVGFSCSFVLNYYTERRVLCGNGGGLLTCTRESTMGLHWSTMDGRPGVIDVADRTKDHVQRRERCIGSQKQRTVAGVRRGGGHAFSISKTRGVWLARSVPVRSSQRRIKKCLA
ncbi:hypothetical protein KI387_034313 [Taxus chinensis]|uniref:SPRY domain-containing protein n=1 Tax=Taxus chinensis TaxID=29808 RepID=A0AA38BWX8_TAXCH|nr:hypothetical protein KI387_034313 [Taxus chinensis]